MLNICPDAEEYVQAVEPARYQDGYEATACERRVICVFESSIYCRFKNYCYYYLLLMTILTN